MNSCIFCKIASKQIPADIVYEDEHSVAFLDIHPKAPGHTLVIPKTHYQWMRDVPDETIGKLFTTAKQIMRELEEKYSANYIKLSVVGKDVPHFHIHLIPQKLS